MDLGYRSLIISVDLERAAAKLLGNEINKALIDSMSRIPNLDPCGERGEYHSFVFDGPLFKSPVPFERGGTFESHNHKLLDLIPATDPAAVAR